MLFIINAYCLSWYFVVNWILFENKKRCWPVGIRTLYFDVTRKFFWNWKRKRKGIQINISKCCECRFLASSCLSVRRHKTTRLSLDGFSRNLTFEYLNIWIFEFHWNLKRKTGTSHKDLCTFMTLSRSVLFRMKNISDESCRENQNTHFVFNNFFFSKICRLWDMEKYTRDRQATYGNTAHVHCALDN
jgi:hypothetical protein